MLQTRYPWYVTQDPGVPDRLTVTGILPVVERLPPDCAPDAQAEAVGLTYVNDGDPGISRLRCGTGFTYRFPDGATVPRDHPARRRAEELAIPPAWTDVWVCLAPEGHIQATGRDEANRKQYLYHPHWRSIRDATKFHRLATVGGALPRIREDVSRQLRTRSFTREKMLALIVALLDETLLRVGNDEYLRANGSFGLTTLEHDHVEVDGNRVRFSFPGKSGQEYDIEVNDARLARQVLRCEEIPGQQLFSFQDGDDWHPVDSADVNTYLSEVAGEALTAKDFRTWGGTVIAADRLHQLGPADGERELAARVLEAIDDVADRLCNTRAVARSSYVDPRIPRAYEEGWLDEAWDTRPGRRGGLSAAERAVRRILERASA